MGVNVRARVYRSSGRDFDCKVMTSGKMLQAVALGKLLKKDNIVVGDYVELEDTGNGDFCIVSVEKRETEIFRILVRENRKKVTAANVDCLVIFTSVSRPAFKRGIVDRFLVRACQWGIKPLVVFNKMDEHQEEKLNIVHEEERLKFLGVNCFEISAKQGEAYKRRYLSLGIEQFKNSLEGSTALFVGQSGVGKSKTISYLSGGEVSLKTQKVGKVGKGSHTTTWSEIIELSHFVLIDSPGIRSFSLEDIDPNDLLEYFPDLEEIAIHCQFSNCTHDPKTKGCAFFNNDWDQARAARVLSRLDSYHKMLEEIGRTPQWAKKL